MAERTLADYAGNWQSVYPLLKDGTLDQVFDYKAKLKKDKTPAEYKTYYDAGYQTDVDHINITDSTIEFLVDGKPQKFTYKAAGYKILNYAKGNRGVRFLLKQTMPMLGGLNTSNLVTTTSHQRKPLISTSSSAAIAKKVCSMKWTTGQRIIQTT